MKILIVKTSSLGDLIHVFPVVDYLKEKYPEAQIDWIVEKPFAELIVAHPKINQVLTIQSKLWRKSFWKPSVWRDVAAFRRLLQSNIYDLVFDLQGNTKSGFITGLARSDNKVGFARGSVPEWPNLLFTKRRFTPPSGQNIRSDYLSIVQQYFGDSAPFVGKSVQLKINEQNSNDLKALLENTLLKDRNRILVCPGSAWPNKQTSKETLKGFLQLLSNEEPSCFLFAWGSAEEESIVRELHTSFPENSLVIPRLSLSVLQNLMAGMNLVIAMDSLPLHLAGTTGVKTFGIFGASSASKYNPVGPQHLAIQGTCPYGQRFDKRCPVLRTCPTGACIKELTPNNLKIACLLQINEH